MGKNLLIVGIDPGTTVGYAVIDLYGNLVDIGSSKQLNLSLIISKIIKIGKVLIVGTDKKKIPDFVSKFSTKIGGSVISLEADLLVKEKKELTSRYKFNNDHERDSLASALYSYKKIEPLLKKIESYLKNNNKIHLFSKIVDLLLNVSGLTIKSAVELIERPEKKEVKIIKKVIEKKEISKQDFIQIFNQVNNLEKTIKLLRGQNSKLIKERLIREKKQKYLSKKIDKVSIDKKYEKKLDFKEDRIQGLFSQLKGKDHIIFEAKEEIMLLNYFLSDQKKKFILKKLDNLGFIEFASKNKVLKIQKDDILYVKNPNIVSNKVISKLKNVVNIILYKEKLSKKIEGDLGFIFIDSEKLKIKESKYYAIVDRLSLEKEKNSNKMLNKIISDYKNQRIS